MNIRKEIRKRGLSGVVVTIMLVFLAVSAIAIIAALIIPWVKESLSDDCFKMIGKAEIDEGAYACYSDVSGNYEVLISVKLKDVEFEGLIVNIYGEGTSKRFEIPGEDVEMKDGGAVELPNAGEERTYKFVMSKEPGSAELGIVTKNGNICEVDSAELYLC